MPPRKSAASNVSAAPMSPHGAGDVSILSATTAVTTDSKSPAAHKPNRQSAGHDADGEKTEKKKSKNDDLGIDDLLLPRTLTSRLARGTLPANTSIQRDALLALTKSATVFISYLAHNANNLTSRKTIQSQDVLEALRETELWNVALVPGSGLTLGERVSAEVERWEGEVRGKRKGYRDRVKARESGVTVGGTEGQVEGEAEAEVEGEDGAGRGPVAKRARRDDDEGDTTMDVDADPEEQEDDDENGPAAAQPRTEDDVVANGDGTETDPDVADEDEDEDVEEEEDEDEEQDESEDDEDKERDDARKRTALAPNGRIEVGSDEESD